MRILFSRHIFSFILASLLFASCSGGTHEGTTDVAEDIDVDKDTVLLKEADEEIGADPADLILLAFMNNRMQYMMGEIAQQQASSEAVRDYAESIVTRDHETRQKLENIAQATDSDMPEAIGAEKRAVIDSIRQLPAERFDEAYMSRVIYEYRENIDRLNELIRDADNPMIEGTAAEIIDIQRDHMQRAARVMEEIS
jgi:predicted outer membrane protein